MLNVLEEIKTKAMEQAETTVHKVTLKVVKYGNLACSGSSTTIDKGGILSSAVIEYVIETQPMKWTVTRKYDDLMWLREQLQKHFPGSIVSGRCEGHSCHCSTKKASSRT
jgi:hypothetical protein